MHLSRQVNQARREVIECLLDTRDLLARLHYDHDGVVAGRNIAVRIDNRFTQIGDAALPPGAGKIRTDRPPFFAHGVTVTALPFTPEERLAAGAIAGSGGVVVPVNRADVRDHAADVLLAQTRIISHVGS